MKIITIGKERTLDSLIARVQVSKASAADRRIAAAAILRANPGLDPLRIPKGATIVVPPVPGAKSTVTSELDPTAQQLESIVTTALDALLAHCSDTADVRSSELAESVRVLNRAELKEAAVRRAIAKPLDAARIDLDAEILRLKTTRAAIETAAQTWRADLRALADSIGGQQL